MMKSIIIIIIITLFLSCKKQNSSIKPKNIVGKWEWIFTYADGPISSTNPKTPINTGNKEYIIFYPDQSWSLFYNNTKTDSGNLLTGHGKYKSYPNNFENSYDNILYYNVGFSIKKGVDFYDINNDTLIFNPYLAGVFQSYSLPNNGSKWFVKKY